MFDVENSVLAVTERMHNSSNQLNYALKAIKTLIHQELLPSREKLDKVGRWVLKIIFKEGYLKISGSIL